MDQNDQDRIKQGIDLHPAMQADSPLTVALKDVANRFTYHPPKPGQPEKYEYFRGHARCLAEEVVKRCPQSPERSLALEKLEQAVFYINASIARHE